MSVWTMTHLQKSPGNPGGTPYHFPYFLFHFIFIYLFIYILLVSASSYCVFPSMRIRYLSRKHHRKLFNFVHGVLIYRLNEIKSIDNIHSTMILSLSTDFYHFCSWSYCNLLCIFHLVQLLTSKQTPVHIILSGFPI